MSFVDDDRHAFVIRLWREPREVDDDGRLWRGTIEHIPSGDRRAVTEMADITGFIDEHLDILARRRQWQRTVRAWLSRRPTDDGDDDPLPPFDADSVSLGGER